MLKRYAWVIFDAERDQWDRRGPVAHEAMPDRVIKPEQLWIFGDDLGSIILRHAEFGLQWPLECPAVAADFSDESITYEEFLKWICVLEVPTQSWVHEVVPHRWPTPDGPPILNDMPSLTPGSRVRFELSDLCRAIVIIGSGGERVPWLSPLYT